MPAIKSEISAISSEKNLPSREILIVDQHVEANEILLAGLARPIEIVALEPYLPPIEQIATILANHPGIETLHILAHGEPGALALAGQMLGTADLAHQSAALASIKDSLAASAEIALWACSVAANTDGRIFVDALEAATGARVFAADRPVGAASGGGTWDIGTASPFGAAAMAAYPHTLPTFDFTGGSGNGTATYTETESGVTMTVVDDTGDTASVFNAGTAAGLSGDAIAFGGTGSLTVTFDQGVTVTSFRYVEDDGSLVGTDSVIFTPIGGTGSTITKLPGDFANSGFDVTPADWVGVTGFTVTYIGTTPIDPILDTIVFNVAPTITGEPTDLIVTEDAAGNLDLSSVTVADSDGDNLTVTLSVDSGTFSTPGDGATAGFGVIETLVNSTTITLVGDAASINFYLDTASNIQYTGASNAAGNDVATLTITPNDGTIDGTAATVNIDITAINDAPVLDNTGSPTLTGINENAGDDDSSGADGDDDATNNTNNNGTTVASLVVDGSITDVDGSAVESIAVTAVDNTNGVWQYSINGGTNWLNFSGTTGSNVDIESAARLLFSTNLVRFVPNANYSGTATITFRAWDEVAGSAGGTANVATNGGVTSFSAAQETATITVSALNDAPTGSNATVTINEDASHTFTAANFGFSDVDAGDTLSSVRIDVQTITSGTLQLSGADVTNADIITVADINAGNLVYTPAPDANGNALLSFTFSVNDGTAFAVSPSTLTVDVAPVSDNARPGEPSLSNASVAENAEGAVVGTLTSIDPDGDAVSFSALGDARFEVVDGILKLQDGVSLNFEDSDSVRVSVRAIDDQGGSFIKSFTITVTDVNEAVAVGGTDTADTVDGSDDADALYGAGGDDTVGGGLGDDKLGGGGGADTLDGGSGGDILFGGSGNDELSGGTGDDVIYNGSGADSVNGGTGSDTIWAGAGDDILTGGTGADTFIFGATSGNDRITDFDTSEDTLDLQYSGAGFASLAGVEAASSETTIDGDAGVLIDLGGGQSVFLAGLGLGDLASVTLVL